MPIPGSLPRETRRLAREEVYAQLRDWIIDGTLGPGEIVREQELATALEVSRTPVREALRRLENMGLVYSEANRSARVSPMEISDVRNIYPIIGILEPLAIRMSEGRISQDVLDEMHQANESIRALVDSPQQGEAAVYDERFHNIVSSRCNNPELIGIIANLRVKLRRMAHAYFMGRIIAERSVQEHALVVEALRAGRFEAAAEASEAHWRGSLERFLDHTTR